MQAASIHQLKKEMRYMDRDTLVQLCLRLAKHKKENKELLTYLIFDSSNENYFKTVIKNELSEMVTDANRANIYWTKKGLSKSRRYLDKVIRFSGRKDTEAELRIHFIREIFANKIPISRSRVLQNMMDMQVQKIRKAIEKIHPDLQFDLNMELEELFK